MLINIS